MKKFALSLLVAIPGTLFVAAADCGGGGIVTCASDADCTTATNSIGEATPFCDLDALVCTPDLGECTADLDCQLINPDAPTTIEDCATNDECADDGSEVCVQTTGATVCALVGGGDCGGDVEVSAEQVEGGNADVCASADGTCEANGGCTF